MTRTVGIAALLAALAAPAPAIATEYVLDQSEADFLTTIDDQLLAGRQLLDVEMREIQGEIPRYSGVFAPVAGTVHVVLGVYDAEWDAFLADMEARTGRWLDFEIETFGPTTVRRSGIFLENAGPDYAYALRSDHDEAAFEGFLDEYREAGLAIIDFEAFVGPTGVRRFGGLWVDGPGQPRTHLFYGLDWAEAQDLLSTRPGRVVDLERYLDDADRERWGVIVAMYPDGDSAVEIGLDEATLAATDAGRTDRLIDFDVFESSPGVLSYDAVWGDDWKSLREVDPYPASNPVPFGDDIQNVIDAFEADGVSLLGLFAMSVRGNESIEYRADDPFYLASASKVAIHARLWQLFQAGDVDLDTDTLQYGTSTAVPWYVDERGDPGFSTGPCPNPDLDLDLSLRDIDAAMMQVSDNAATSMLVDDTTFGTEAGPWPLHLNEWLAGVSGAARGWGLVTSIQDVERLLMWQGQQVTGNDAPSYFTAPGGGLASIARTTYRECQDPAQGNAWTGNRCGACGMVCPGNEVCVIRQDPWGDLTTWLLDQDPDWTAGTFPNCTATTCTRDYPRYYAMGVNHATPRAFGLLQEAFATNQLLDRETTDAALAVMTEGTPLRLGVPSHIDDASKGGVQGGAERPCTETSIFRLGLDQVVLAVLTKDNQRPCSCPTGQGFFCGNAAVKGFLANPLGNGDSMGTIVLRRLTADLKAADPVVATFSPTTVRQGQPFEAVLDVTNTGQIDAPGFAVTFYAVDDGTIGDGDDVGIGTVRVDGLAAGETVRVRMTKDFPFIQTGTYEFGWVIDPTDAQDPHGEVGEFTEGADNRGLLGTSVLTVLPPPPPCTDDDLDGHVDCDADCDPTGFGCGDCDTADGLVSPVGVDTCNQRDDDCDGVPDPGAATLATTRSLEWSDSQTSEEYGTAIASIGDLDGDGVEEFAVGRPGADTPSRSDAGVVHVYDGATGAFRCTAWDPNSNTSDRFGTSIAAIGDVTGDPTPDFVVGSPFHDSPSANTGRMSVIDGATCDFAWAAVFSQADGGDQLGTVVAGAGDLDFDGVPDILASAPYHDGAGTDRGAVFAFSGATGAVLRAFEDPASPDNDRVGFAIAVPGDLDGDLVPDIVASTIRRDGDRGALVVFSGQTAAVFGTWTRPGSAGGDKLGHALAALEDVTGDGIPEIVAGAIDRDTLAGQNAGDAVVFSGADGTIVHTLSDISGGAQDELGYAVASVGDVDGDGFDDVAVGSWLHDTDAGADAGAVVVFSGATGAPLLDLEDPDGAAGDRMGSAVARLDDLTGDGRPEFAAGAPRADGTEAANAGRIVIWSVEADCDLDGATPFDGDCDDREASAGPIAKEICDAIDNDCDGLVDEDDDGDGYASCDDCDDADARVFPGAVERCNGGDDDCDTEIDEGVDADLDGYTDVCDCDDGADAVNPGMIDATCDRIDQDCNGVTDDGFDTPPGERALDLGAGASQDDDLGAAVAVVGDLDGDGLAEIAAAVEGEDSRAGGAGAVALFDGATGALHCLLTDPDGALFDHLGASVAAAGDVTGDGVADVLAGATDDDDPANGAGSVVVFDGATCAVAYKTFDPQGETGAGLGFRVASIGDLDGDGRPEFAASAPAGDASGLTNSGRVVVFDGATGGVLYRVNNVNPIANEEFGQAIAGGRDLDADGVPDFVVGTPRDNTRVGTNSGAIVVFSGATGVPIRKIVDDDGGLSDALGRSLALIDDLDGDHVADIVAGESEDDTAGTNAGAVLVFSGADGRRIGKATFDSPGTQERLGTSVAALPDIDGDGIADIAAGAPKDDDGGTDTGAVYLISGADLSLIRRVWRASGQAGAEIGTSIAIAPDLTGDGMPEIVAGAPFHDLAGGTNAGQVVVFALEADCDGDGVSPFGGDCNDGDGSAFGRPGDVEALVFTDKDHVSWQPPGNPGGTVAGLAYDVLRSATASDFETAATCVESGDTDTTATVAGVPAPGDGLFYLVRASNACDVGPAGYDSTPAERPAAGCP